MEGKYLEKEGHHSKQVCEKVVGTIAT